MKASRALIKLMKLAVETNAELKALRQEIRWIKNQLDAPGPKSAASKTKPKLPASKKAI